MTDTAEIIKAVNGIHESMDTGFTTIHEKMDKKFNQCDKRLTSVETIIEVKKALCRKEKDDEKNKKDYWQPVIRTITIVGILALLGIAGKLLIFGITKL